MPYNSVVRAIIYIEMNINDKNSITETVETEIAAIKQLRSDLIANDSFSEILNLLENTKGRIILTGMGKSGIIAKKISASLSSTGSPSYFLHPAEASHGDMGLITKDDITIAISNGGESKELADVINYCHRFAVPLIGITKNPNSTLGRNVDYILRLPDSPEADTLGLAPTSSTTATLVMGDIITVALMARKGFTKADFQARHPGGKLGAVLQKAGDFMHTGEEMPLLPETAAFPEILLEMTKKRMGCVGFTDKNGILSGIFTDGDLRRQMSPDLFNKNGKDIMHLSPVCQTRETLLSDVLRLMNTKKITNMFITDNGFPLGIIHLHDLLNLKIV